MYTSTLVNSCCHQRWLILFSSAAPIDVFSHLNPMSYSRRRFLIGLAGCAVSYGMTAGISAAQEKKSIRVILLGTKGGPRVGVSGRSNPSTLLLINDVPYVVDCGYGSSRQLLAAGVPLNRLRYIF